MNRQAHHGQSVPAEFHTSGNVIQVITSRSEASRWKLCFTKAGLFKRLETTKVILQKM